MKTGDILDIMQVILEKCLKNIRKQLNELGIKDP